MSNTELVIAFLHAWDEMEFDAVFEMMSEDIVYKNSGFPDAFGHEGVRQTLAPLLDKTMPMTSVVHSIAENADGVVMTERTDTLHLQPQSISFPVMGAFDVRDGKITGWRDYFDPGQFEDL